MNNTFANEYDTDAYETHGRARMAKRNGSRMAKRAQRDTRNALELARYSFNSAGDIDWDNE